MAARPSNRRRAAPRDPREMRPAELEALIQACRRKVEIFEDGMQSPFWAIVRTRLKARAKRLEHETVGLQRRLIRPAAGQPPVTLEQIASQRARIEENADLLRTPEIALGLWRGQIAELETLRERSTS